MKELIEIQSRLKAEKKRYNKFGDFKYRSCEDILDALKPLLKDNCCYLVLSDEIVLVGSRYYVKATATLRGESGEICNSAYARECESRAKMDEAQVTGSASTYARKYALNGLFCIDDSKDPDGQDNSSTDSPVESESTYSELKGEIDKKLAAAKTFADLTAIYNDYDYLREDRSFITSISKRKAEISNVKVK